MKTGFQNSRGFRGGKSYTEKSVNTRVASRLFMTILFSGLKHFCSLYGESLYRLQAQSGPPIKLEGDTLDTIQQQLEKQIPLDEIENRREWRDERLAELYRLKHE